MVDILYVLIPIQILTSLLAGYLITRVDKSKPFTIFGVRFTVGEIAFGYMFLITAFMTLATSIKLREIALLITFVPMFIGLYIGLRHVEQHGDHQA